MKKMNKLTVAALALAAFAFASTGASAQIAGYQAGDLILGFQVYDGTGVGTNLEVDLGQYTSFTTSATLTLNQLSSADLVATFGSGWANTTTGVSWDAASTSATARSFYATSSFALPTDNSNSNLSGPHGAIGAEASYFGNNGVATANSSKSAIFGGTPAAGGIAGTYTNEFQAGTNDPLNTGYGYGSQISQSVGASSVQLYSFVSGSSDTPATDLGTLKLDSAGDLTFTGSAVAVPEPSTYALGICTVLLFIVLRRRARVS